MCLIVFSYKNHSDYDLILAANRDEDQSRPTRAAQFWNEQPNILAGKDLKAGGTWMGINKRGNFAALTNYRDLSINKTDPPSRGQLVLNYLEQQDEGAKAYLKDVQKEAQRYMGFNLLAGSPDNLFYYSNQQQTINRIEPGVHGLSNHLLNSPWPKVQKSTKKLREVTSGPFSAKDLFELLKDDKPAADEALPDTGIGQELEKKVSPIFIKSKGYGTRCSTVLLIDKKGNVTFEEKRFKANSLEVKESSRYEFTIARK